MNRSFVKAIRGEMLGMMHFRFGTFETVWGQGGNLLKLTCMYQLMFDVMEHEYTVYTRYICYRQIEAFPLANVSR